MKLLAWLIENALVLCLGGYITYRWRSEVDSLVETVESVVKYIYSKIKGS